MNKERTENLFCSKNKREYVDDIYLYIYILTFTDETQRSWVTCHLSHRGPVLRMPAASGPGGCHVAFMSHALPTPELGLAARLRADTICSNGFTRDKGQTFA